MMTWSQVLELEAEAQRLDLELGEQGLADEATFRAEVARKSLELAEAVVKRDAALAQGREAGFTLRELSELSGLSVEGVRRRLGLSTVAA